MSTTQVRHLIEEINYLLSRPIGSVSRASSPETLQQREQLKHLRSQLESATEDRDLSDLAQECNLLISQIKGEVQPLQVQPLQIQPSQIKQVQPLQIDAHRQNKLEQNKLDKLDIRQKFSERSPLLHISQPSFLSNNSDLIKEGSIMADTPESNLPSNLPSMNEQIVAIVQRTIHQTIQNAVAQSVQESIEQNLKQTLIAERSAIVSEISANLKSFVDLQVDSQIDSQQRSQSSQELELLEQQKQALRQEIVKLEADRQTWMAQFAQVARSQQEAFAQSLQQTLQSTLHETVTQSVNQSVNRTVSQSLIPSLNTQEQGIDEAARSEASNRETRSPEFVQHVQQQTDRFLLNLDAMFNATFRSLEQNIHSYKTTMTEQLDQMQSLEQKGKSLIDSLVEQVSVVTQNSANQNSANQSASTPSPVEPEVGTLASIDLPADIDPRYFDTTPEHIDEVLVSTLLAGGDATHLYPDVIHDTDVLDEFDLALDRDRFSDRLEPEMVSQSADLDSDPDLNSDFDTTAVTEPFDLVAIADIPKSSPTSSSTSSSLLAASLEKSLEISKQKEKESNLDSQTSDFLQVEEDLSNEDPALLAWLERQAQLPKHDAEDDETDLTSWLNHKSIAFSQSTRADDIKGLNRPSDTDNAENSDESLILLPDVPDRAPDPSKWIDELMLQDLNADLENLAVDREASAAIASSLNQVIRDTPFSGVPAEMASAPRQPAIQLSQSSSSQSSSSQSSSSRSFPSKLSASLAEVTLGSNSGSNLGANLDLTLDRDLELLGIPQIIENPDDLFVDASDGDDCVIQGIQETPSFAIDPEIYTEVSEAVNPFVSLANDPVDSEILPFDASSLPAIEPSRLESTSLVIPNAVNEDPFDGFESTEQSSASLLEENVADTASPFAIADQDETAALFVEEMPTKAIPIAIEIRIAEDEPEAVAAETFSEEIASVEVSPPDDAEAIFAEVLASQAKGKSSVVPVSTETEDEIDALFLGLNVNPPVEPVSPYNSSTKFTPVVVNPEANKPTQSTQTPKKSLTFPPATPSQIPNINPETRSSPNSAIEREFEKVMNDLEHDIDQDLETLILAIDPNPNPKSNPNIAPSQKASIEIKPVAIQDPPLSDSDSDFGDEFDELDRMLQSQPEEIEPLPSKSTSEVDSVDDILSLSEQFETVLQELAIATPTEQDLRTQKTTPNPIMDSDADDFSQVLDDLEASLPDPSPIHSIKSPNLNPSLAAIEEELSAEDFFASLGSDRDNDGNDISDNLDLDRTLTEFADLADRDISDDDFLKAIEDELLSSDRDLQLSNFADSGELDRVDGSSWEQFVEKASTFSGLAISDSSSDRSSDSMNELESVLFGLEAIDFDFESKSNQFEKLDLSTEERTLDVESQVIASERATPIPPEPPEPPYSIHDTWFLGIDFGSTYMRSSLVNAQTGRVYPLTMHSSGELSEQVVFNSNFASVDRASDRSSDRNIDGAIQHVSTQTASADTAISHFKSFLKLGLPYRGLSAWQPMLQWSHSQQITLKSLVTALQDLFVKLQSEVSHDKLPDLHEILQNLSGAILGHPPEWSDTYVHNLREAVLNAGIVTQAEQVMVVDQAIAPVLWCIHQNKSIQQITLAIDAGAATTSLCLIKALGDAIDRSHIYSRSIDYAGLGIDQDIVTQLLYPHWQIVTNPARESCHLDPAILPEPSDPAPMQRALLQQTLLSSTIGKKLLEFANQIKLELFSHPDRVQWSQELEGQPLTVQRREVESQILQPYIQRLNRELNLLLSIAGMTGEDVAEVWQLGGTMAFPSLSRWLVQKLPFANMNTMPISTVANGLAVAPLFPQLLDISRQQYSDYFLLQEICRLNLRDALTPKSLLQQLQNRGINIKVCRDRILTFLQGDLPSGLFPWQEPEKNIVLPDPSFPSELFTGRLFELETDGSYKPNVLKFQQLSNYLQSILATMRQTLNEPLVFPEFKIAVKA